jgi:hypothetical protein
VYTTAFRNEFWVLNTLTLTSGFDQGSATVLPQQGRNSYAFFQNLSPAALFQVQNAFNNSTTAGGSAFGSAASVLGGLYGSTPCNGSTAIRKVWNPQLQQFTRTKTDRWSAQAGLRGRFGSDWRWDFTYYYGANDSDSRQENVATTLRLAFAMDAVIDDRTGSPTYGKPICRVTRDGSPVLDTVGRPLSNPDSLAALAAGCRPLNVLGNAYSTTASFRDAQGNPYSVNGVPVTYDAAALQQQAIDYAFVETVSAGRTTRQSASFTTSGTLYQGWAGPLRSAFSLDLSEDTNNNVGTAGDAYLRSDLVNSWQDAFSGKTRQLEPSVELTMPIVSGQEGISLFSVGATYRYGFYNVVGGSGTTGEEATQRTPSWRVSAEFAPFDWARFRMTRSQDMRAAGYRELFIYQPSEPDQFESVARTHGHQQREPARAFRPDPGWQSQHQARAQLDPDSGSGALPRRLGAGHARVDRLHQCARAGWHQPAFQCQPSGGHLLHPERWPATGLRS